MKAKILIITLLIVVSLLASACMREAEVCNYDGICLDSETDNCADCRNVLGRGVEIENTGSDNSQDPTNS